MKKIIPYWIILAMLLGIILYQALCQRKENHAAKEINQQILEIKLQLICEKNEKLILSETRNNELSLNGQKIKGHIIDLDKNEFDIHTINKKDRLYYYCSSSHCLSCIQNVMLNMKRNSLFKLDDIGVLIHTKDIQFAKVLAANNSLTYSTYILHEDFTPNLTEQKSPLYFIVEGSNMRINSAFSPFTDAPEITESYLNSVSKKTPFF